jgi:cytochrome oxidase Cu insertion factor (SCO1/SenC/PrrC family)
VQRAAIVVAVLILFAVGALAGCGSGKNRKQSPGITNNATASIPAGGQTATITTNGTTTTG